MLLRIVLSSIALTVVAGCATFGTREPAVSGEGMNKEQIRGVIRDHIIPIRHCYEKELKTSPKLAGKLVLEWEIGDLGKVTKVSVLQSVQENLDQCVSDVIKGALFPTPPNGQIGRVSYPFVFNADPNKAIN